MTTLGRSWAHMISNGLDVQYDIIYKSSMNVWAISIHSSVMYWDMSVRMLVHLVML